MIGLLAETFDSSDLLYRFVQIISLRLGGVPDRRRPSLLAWAPRRASRREVVGRGARQGGRHAPNHAALLTAAAPCE